MKRKEFIKQRISDAIVVLIMIIAMIVAGFLGYKHRDKELEMEQLKGMYQEQIRGLDYNE